MKRTSRGRRKYWLLFTVGALLVIGTIAWQLNAAIWMHHSNTVGNALVAKERKLQHHGKSNTACTAESSKSVVGLMEIPKISLTAPVEQGTSDAVLNVAIGHDSYSVWPGTNGSAVFNAHDVSYFVNIDQLKRGDRLIYQTACTEYDFVVQSHAIVAAGSPVYNTPGPSVTIVTCWPTNALWFTPDRYLVTAVEVAKRSVGTPGSTPPALTGVDLPPSVTTPTELTNQGLTLATNYAPMGSMTITGAPSQQFKESPGPLNMEFSALGAYFGGIKSLEQNQLGWWRGLAPQVSPITPLIHSTVTSYSSPLNVSVSAQGSIPTGVEFHTDVMIVGGSSPGAYAIDVVFSIHGGHLTITSWKMTKT